MGLDIRPQVYVLSLEGTWGFICISICFQQLSFLLLFLCPPSPSSCPSFSPSPSFLCNSKCSQWLHPVITPGSGFSHNTSSNIYPNLKQRIGESKGDESKEDKEGRGDKGGVSRRREGEERRVGGKGKYNIISLASRFTNPVSPWKQLLWGLSLSP